MERGAQLGNTNGARGKVWRDALDKAVKQYVDKDAGIKRGEALFKIATRVVAQALTGNKDAIQELGNRLDGKPHQSMDIGIHDSTPLEEMTDAELAGELIKIRELTGGDTAKTRCKSKPARVH
jgi:hypothetical protein